MRNIEVTGLVRERRGLPVLGARRGRADVLYELVLLGLLLLIVDEASGLEVHSLAARDVAIGISRQQLARLAIENVNVPVTVGMNEGVARLAFPLDIDEDAFIDPVVVGHVVRAELIEPTRLAGIHVARKNARGP